MYNFISINIYGNIILHLHYYHKPILFSFEWVIQTYLNID